MAKSSYHSWNSFPRNPHVLIVKFSNQFNCLQKWLPKVLLMPCAPKNFNLVVKDLAVPLPT